MMTSLKVFKVRAALLDGAYTVRNNLLLFHLLRDDLACLKVNGIRSPVTGSSSAKNPE